MQTRANKMAALETQLENTCKVFKCHPNSKVPKIVICLICENVYHEGDFNKYSKGRYISEMLVICPKHHQENLTSNLDYDLNTLDENARKVIAQIKLFQKEELRNELCQNLTLNASKNLSEVSDLDIDEVTTLRMENELLRQLNSEIQARNKLLETLMCKDDRPKPSYASIVKKTEKVLSIFVKAKNNNNQETLDKVKQKLTSDLTIPINNVKKSYDGLVSIKCKNAEDVSRTKSVLSEKLGCEFSVELEHLKLPRIKVVNIENDLSKEDICEDIYNRNFLDLDGAFNVIGDYTNSVGKRTLILEVTSKSYLQLKNNGFKMYIGHQRCKVFDYFNVNLCFKCGRSNHNHKKCVNDAKCLICAGDHLTNTCKSSFKKCLNCEFYNEKYQKNRPTDHCATDTSCEYLVYKMNTIINSTDYPIKPDIPKTIGKIGNNFITNNLQQSSG